LNGSAFRLRIVTPLSITEREVTHIRLKDASGFFGIMRDHTDFLTVLEPSVCYYTGTDGREFFLAVNGGVLSFKQNTATITSPEVYESGDAESLSKIIETAVARKIESEMSLRMTLEGIERSFLEKNLELARGRP
jgi:F-type H+-transporting ATPase subunit epsilon